jgi:hypothetical protein
VKATGSAVSVFMVRKGEHVSFSAAGDLVTVGKGEPDLFGHVVKMGGRQVWKVTVGKNGQVLAHGWSWWRLRAKLRARAVAQRPSILRQVRLWGAE